MFEMILDALIDSLKILPLLFIVYLIIELIEVKGVNKFNSKKILSSAYAPLFGVGIGLIPQCGFSVVATDLFSKKKISIATLLAIYIATSDEAIPVILSNPSKILMLFPLLLSKVIFALLVGYSTYVILKFVHPKAPKINKQRVCHRYCQVIGTTTISNNIPTIKTNLFNYTTAENIQNIALHEHTGCCGHDINAKTDKIDITHPLIHTLKVFIYILIVNLIMGFVIFYVGETNFTNFLNYSTFLQPILATLIGLIPNCASSVVLTELYINGGLALGSVVAGLSINAGIAFTVLFKQNKNIKENIFIVVLLFILSILFGYIINAII